jgi:predicted nuclease of predicted toxin-antitoxin system
VKFLVDNQLPSALAHFLRSRGLDCQHVLDVGLAEAPDSEICRYAEDQGRIIVTKDEDFLYLASRPKSQIKVLWVRLGNCRTKTLLRRS